MWSFSNIYSKCSHRNRGIISNVDLGTDSQVHPDVLLHWLRKQVALYDTVHIADMGSSFKDGLAICAIIHRYRPDLIDFHSLKPEDIEKNNQIAFDILEKELGISPVSGISVIPFLYHALFNHKFMFLSQVFTGDEMASCEVPDKLAMFSYLTQIYETFRGEIPHIKHPKLVSSGHRYSQLYFSYARFIVLFDELM